MLETIIHSPFPRDTTQGNTITADRLEGILINHGISTSMSAVTYDGAESACMVALNAWRSADAVASYKAKNPQSKIVIIITGSDINNEEMADPASVTRQTMQSADALVMLHDIEFQKLPSDLQAKCTVIYPSVSLPDEIVHQPSESKHFRVIMAGNLRPVKNPQLAIDACRLLPDDSPIQFSIYGSAGNQEEQLARQATSELSNYQWHGMTTHHETLEHMCDSDLLLNTSVAEGGANALCEAITMGLPVIASDIRGNIGMLGNDYPGLYPSENAEALAEILQKSATEPSFYKQLKEATLNRARLFSYEEESKLWIKLIKSVI